VPTWLQKRKKKEKKEHRKDDRMLFRCNLTLSNLIFCILCNWKGKVHLNRQKKMAITRELWIQYILPPLSLQNRGTMKTLLCTEDQNGNSVVYHNRTHVPFGPLFSTYISNMGILPISGHFLSNGRRIGHSETPKGMGFDTSFRVIIFINLLKFINQDKLEY
jgi:hypothetical protein